MAIDTVAKRRSVTGVTFPLAVAVTPDADNGQAWRQGVGWSYIGILARVGTRVVTGTIYKPDGSVWASVDVRFELLAPGGYESGGAIYPGHTVVATTNASGVFSINLWRSGASVETAKWRCTLPSGETFGFEIPDAGTSIDLSTLRAA